MAMPCLSRQPLQQRRSQRLADVERQLRQVGGAATAAALVDEYRRLCGTTGAGRGVDIASVRPQVRGALGAGDAAVYLTALGAVISPWHDIPLAGPGGTFHYVNEIPRGATLKMEVQTAVRHNPIAPDVRNGAPRVLTYGGRGCPFNYGMLPQTFADPTRADPATGRPGDGDPLDVVELGARPLRPGAVRAVKVLGCLALIDQGETDWKVLAIDARDPRAHRVRSVADWAAEHGPRELDRVRDWFRWYKTADGGRENTFAFAGEYQGPACALRVIREGRSSWGRLVAGELRTTEAFALPEARPAELLPEAFAA